MVQVTPLLGILQSARLMWKAKTSKMLPSKIHLIWAVKNLEELRLLDKEVLDSAE